ncbi:hypothetical protein QQF64_035106 [Cirrhinus molitorella]|uniref:Uncharacterized protein n=1 Tax=Cirrhinus molitorella TaxID=172907 RepID=A0ABR3NFH8_9TELE
MEHLSGGERHECGTLQMLLGRRERQTEENRQFPAGVSAARCFIRHGGLSVIILLSLADTNTCRHTLMSTIRTQEYFLDCCVWVSAKAGGESDFEERANDTLKCFKHRRVDGQMKEAQKRQISRSHGSNYVTLCKRRR